ncbi:MAG: glycoside hydrolase family 127 protein [Chloroflexia bacterium]|nr:glycoside hydrolase family 127 protein [Chloroflexia bacterium]
MTVRNRTSATVVDTSRSTRVRLRPVPLDAVQLTDSFWSPRRQINRETTLPSQFQHIEATGRLDNFRRASRKVNLPFQGIYFNDSDVYKWLEGAAWTLATDDAPGLAQMVETAIREITDAQQPDGYLNTYFMFEREAERWSNLRDLHEMYCAGHLIQAAVAHHRATGDDRLLAVARRLADHICAVFGSGPGKRPGTDGHEEIEMALVELYRDTGEPRYLRQAEYFINARGEGLAGGDEYHQDHAPFREQGEIVGHAVRAVYLNAGAADIYAETGEEGLLETLDQLWESMTSKRMYVSGGIGSRYEGEAFGKDYELPNARAYTETCAAIGSVMWSWRMLQLDGEARYADLIEHTLYNAVLPGVSLDGQSYFYQNPLEDNGAHRRQPWFGCACCPPNVSRTLASLPSYLYGVSDDSIWVHLYAEANAHMALPDGRTVELRQRTRYPWDGTVEFEVRGEGAFALRLRIPGWCAAGATLEINGTRADTPLVPGSYVELRREWTPGDMVRLTLPMPVRGISCHPSVAENVGRIALMRGPLLYCVEAADNPGVDPGSLVISTGTAFSTEDAPSLLGGLVLLRGEARVAPPDDAWTGTLYRTADTATGQPPGQAKQITAIPYYAWANREPSPMCVWLRSDR